MRETKRFVALGVSLVAAVGVLLYSGPGQWLVRGYGGDIIAVFFLASVFGFWMRRPWQAASIAFIIAVMLEYGQMYWSTTNAMTTIMFGSVFDGYDVIAYVIGAVFALMFYPWREE